MSDRCSAIFARTVVSGAAHPRRRERRHLGVEPLGATELPWSVFEVRRVFGAVTGTPVRWTVNPAATHLLASSSSITTTPEDSITVEFQVRRINGTARLMLDSNDSLSWTLTAFVHS
ncbi:MAG: hypothetical protein JSR77_02070 [Planctomycetes bacterium]|nr:hypothetical protein [Planctomycetota bacterium]